MQLIQLEDGNYLILEPGMELKVIKLAEDMHQVRVLRRTPEGTAWAWTVSRHPTKQDAEIDLARLVSGLRGGGYSI